MPIVFKPQKSQTNRYFDLEITDLDAHCRGIGKANGKTWFVTGTMPGDKVRAETMQASKNTGTASVQKFYEKSPSRAEIKCPMHGKCGGCPCMHVPNSEQLKAKLEGVKQTFRKNAGIDLPEPDEVMEGEAYAYRRTCRLSTYTGRDGVLKLGFREQGSDKIADIEKCPILVNELEQLLPKIKSMLNTLESRRFIGHVELTKASNLTLVTLRHGKRLTGNDEQIISKFAQDENIDLYVIEGKNSPRRIRSDLADPKYESNGLSYIFDPESFIQVNGAMNEHLVRKAVTYADVTNNETALDLFCGVGNFALQMAKTGGKIIGVECVKKMVTLARTNAMSNGITNVTFEEFDLTDEKNKPNFFKEKIDVALLDPGRNGANEAVGMLAKLKVPKIVYVSCNPTTAVRDFKKLRESGYVIRKWSAYNMFPNTEHVETVVLLSRN